MRKHNKILTPYARALRKDMTKQEKHLWYDYLKTYPVRILRQKVILNYIVDFYCSKAKLIIEIDGGQHYYDENINNDNIRSNAFKAFGLKVLRFTNDDINNNFEGTCLKIDEKIKQSLYR